MFQFKDDWDQGSHFSLTVIKCKIQVFLVAACMEYIHFKPVYILTNSRLKSANSYLAHYQLQILGCNLEEMCIILYVFIKHLSF